jgi:hypothetical protein
MTPVAGRVHSCAAAARAAARTALVLACAAASAQPVVIDSDEPAETDEAAPATPDDAEQRAAVERARRSGVLTLRVRDVEVLGRWMGGLPAPLERCALLTPRLVSQAMNAVRTAVTAPDALARAGGSAARIEVFWVDADFRDRRAGEPGVCDGAPTVDVVFRPLHLRVATENPAENVLPLARSALGTAYRQVPEALLALNPGVTVDRDAATGTAVGVSLRAPLEALAAGVEAHALVRKSMDAGFHRAEGGLRWLAKDPGPTLVAHHVALQAEREEQPLGASTRTQQSTGLAGGVGLRVAPTARVWLDAAWRGGRDETTDAAAGTTAATTRRDRRATSGRLLLDAVQPQSLTVLRGALWHEAARPDGGTRWAAAAGAAREFRLGGGGLLGVEATLNLGRASGGTPPERLYRGGTPVAQLVYESPLSPALMALPEGPTVRSFGRAQAQLAAAGASARGGTRFWSISLNAAFPVARWRVPLIPDEETDIPVGPDGANATLKQVLMRQVDVTGPSLLAADLQHKGVPPAEAIAQAQRALAPLKPGVRYIVEDAPLFAVRPMLMLDAARLSGGAGGGSARWVAVGAGAQMQLVTARLEAGYMRTVSGPVTAGTGRGACVLRMAFQNLF